MLEQDSLTVLQHALQQLDAGFTTLPAVSTDNTATAQQMQPILAAVAGRMQDNCPYFHPLYAGQMLKPPHPVARAAYALATWINPNNHALDGGRASSRMEMEAVQALAAMFGWKQHLGHLTSGGTFANLEALWIAGQLTGKKKIIASDQAHYTHSRISAVLGLPFASVTSDAQGRMDPNALETLLQAGDIGTVVVTLGATATGAVDPLPRILELQQQYGFRIHVDAAYGGYFVLAGNLAPHTRAAFDAIHRADSIVVDPHKHGLQPYGCGCILFRDPTVGRFYKHDSPYTYFSSEELHLGEISLECSRAGASAVALWATQQLLPYSRDGQFAQGLQQGRAAALELHRRLQQESRFLTAFAPELDIVLWAMRGSSVAESSQRAQAVFQQAAAQDLHLALAQLPVRYFPAGTWPQASAAGHVTCLRSVLMKPEHLQWIDAIWQRLQKAALAVT
jgi:glutamate/tyrosine decarboxylase-like PLP-dependent enzyme